MSTNADEVAFRDEFLTVAAVIYELGGTDVLVARAVGVSEETVSRWAKEIDGFRQVRSEAQRIADDTVEANLFKRANGYSYEAERVIVYKGCPMKVTHRVHVPPDPRSAIYWLMNRQAERWRVPAKLAKLTNNSGSDPLGRFLDSLAGTTLRPRDEDE